LNFEFLLSDGQIIWQKAKVKWQMGSGETKAEWPITTKQGALITHLPIPPRAGSALRQALLTRVLTLPT
jgi:hypothetical protein